ncbi:aminopeptidase N-like isoform X2 [Aricia agestis]|uniref:aminopeptidase N-like isoform X2 n=1 Tax=Aricia agestis TaxID=91739 RepID=UPI001C204302|nr:aminopeptidase N-like isoform X2 [Aricia agestis]
MYYFLIIFTFSLVGLSENKYLSQTSYDFWGDEVEELFSQQDEPSPDLRLPLHISPSFYRLKIKADLDKSYFTGDVYITVKALKNVKEIILHAQDLKVNNVTLTEQIYEKVETLHSRKRRDTGNETTAETIPTTTTNETLTVNETTTQTEILSNATDAQEQNTTESTEPTTLNPLDTQVTHSNLRNIRINSIQKSTGDRLIITTDSPLSLNTDYTLQLSFEGNISNYLTGFYKSSYTDVNNVVRNMGVTQFEPTSARAAFPCFDEPAFKAKFEISIAHPQNISVLSNMKVATQEPVDEDPTWQWTHFERSVNMSTYLVAYVLTDFKYTETSYLSKDNITKPIRIWARPALISNTNYAANITPKLLMFYEDFFGIPYALDKIDLIAIPDFSSGAMENWGLITFKETTLLVDEKEGLPYDKRNVAIDVAHELAHQWFGNLVTMRWWTDLWLNEGFATYIEYVGVNHIEPNWRIFESFSQEKMSLLHTDALKNTSPVSRKVVDAGEIAQKFDEISYSKGANLIRMLNHTISETLFRKGLLIYLNDWKFQNAEENDLWAAMSKSVESDPELKTLSMVKFMNSWTRQAGYPVVNVIRDYDTGRVTFQQKLFTSTNDPHKATAKQIWRIPISYVISNTTDTANTKPKVWLNDKQLSTELDIRRDQALYVNVDAVGYYRVNYDQRNWELLDEAIRTGDFKNPMTKAQLIDDAFNLAKVGQLKYSYALRLSSCVMQGDDSKIVWELLLNNMSFLKHNLRATSGYRYFQDYMRKLLGKQLEKLNYGLDKPKDDNEAFLIDNLIMWDCLVESPRCLKWVRDQFEQLAALDDLNKNPIPSYLRPIVYNIAITHGGRREFEFFWNMYLNSTDPNVQNLIINNLAATREESFIMMLLEKSLGDIPKQYALSLWNVEPPVGTKLAQNFLIENFDRIYQRFTQIDSFSFAGVLSSTFGFITSTDELEVLKRFAIKHKQQLKPMSQTLQKIVDAAAVRIAWIKRHTNEINQWFQDFMKNSSEVTPTPSSDLTQNVTISVTTPNGTDTNTTSTKT